uniref:C2H2-type domain-containing protein n=1 Tax=Clastoptera arizonana TaxID=38151 RepID=A0A1B6D4J0_9HEMI
MAQALFDAINGVAMDNHTVMTVQSLIEAHNRSNLDFGNNDNCSLQDEDDVFQCGKCKKQFISLPDFIVHKKTHYLEKEIKMESNLNSSNTFENLKTMNTTDGTMRPPIILNDTDILSFSMEENELNSPSQVLQSLESGESYLTSDSKALEIGNAENTYRMEAFENQIIISAQMPTNCLLAGDDLDKPDLQFTSQEELNYLTPDCLLTTVDKDSGETVTVSVLNVMQDTLPLNTESVVKDIENDKRLKCLHCGKLFGKNFDLQQHVRSHTGERPYQCVVCGRAFTQKSNVKKHMATHKVWPKPLRTLSTPESEMIDADLKESLVNDSIDRSYHCQFCTAVFPNFYQLKTHRKQHSHHKVYKCIQKKCNETFEDLDLFLEHTTVVHADEAAFHCHLCNKEFASLDDLGTHQYEHGVRPRPSHKSVTCKKCKSRFSSIETLEKHLATDSHNYSCPKCQKVFPCERFLRRHLPIHTKVPLHVCQQCGKAFKTYQYLNIHKVIHSDVKPYVCKVCSVAFNRQDKLVRHSLIHDPQRRFKCPFINHLGCNKEFARKDKLQQHILTHSSSKDLSCKRCNRCFKRNCQLRQHEKACLAQDIPCKDCGHVTSDLECYKKGYEQPSKNITTKRKRRSNAKVKVTKDSKEDNVPTIEIVVLPMSNCDGDNNNIDMNGVYRVIIPSSKPDPTDLNHSQLR